MVTWPAWIGTATRFLRRGSFYLLPPIRINMPVNIHAGSQNERLLNIANRIIRPDDMYELRPINEWKWDIPKSDWSSPDVSDEEFKQMCKRFGQPKQRIFGCELILRSGEILWLDRKQYWKLKGFLLQIGVDI